MKRILITGSEGFIGNALSKKLTKEGFEVVGLSRKECASDNCINFDLIHHSPDRKLTESIDIVIHLASHIVIDDIMKKPKKCILDNVNLTLNIMEDIRINNPKCMIIFVSSDKVYGKPSKGKVDEEDNCYPLDPYGCSKIMCENIIRTYNISYGINFVILRMGNVFGPNQTPKQFIPSIINKIIAGNKNIKVGNLEFYRNFVYINDATDAILLSCINEHAKNNVFNISGYNKKISDVASDIKEITRRILKENIEFESEILLSRKKEIEADKFELNCNKAKKLLLWNGPSIKFEDALNETFKSYSDKR